MDRRSFLGAMLAAGIAPAMVKAENIMPVFVRRESGLIAPLDPFREVYGYDIRFDAMRLRVDTLVGNQHIRLDESWLPCLYSEDLKRRREMMRGQLRAMMREKGMPLYLAKRPPDFPGRKPDATGLIRV